MIDHLPPPIINIVIIIRHSMLTDTRGSCPSSAGCITHSVERERACQEAPSSVYQYWAGRGMKTEWMSGQKKPLEEEHCTCVQRYIDTATRRHEQLYLPIRCCRQTADSCMTLLTSTSQELFGSDRSPKSHNVRSCVRPSGSNLSRALKLHHSQLRWSS